MGGETPIIAKLLLILFFEAKSHLPVTRAVIVLPAFCCADVTTLGPHYKEIFGWQKIYGKIYDTFASVT